MSLKGKVLGLKDKITENMKTAVRGRDQFTVDTLRMALSAIKNKEIEKKSDIDDDTIISLIKTLVKQRKEAAELYRKGDRDDLAEKEEDEVNLLKEYLPEEMGEDELGRIVGDIISETGASSLADMGKVMKLVMAKTAGRAEGRLVNELVKKGLSA